VCNAVIESDVVPHLQNLGLNLYESRAYLALLSGRQLSPKEVGHLGVIPQSRTYDVLESLSSKGLAMATPSSPKLYTAVPYEMILPTHYAKKKKEIQLQAAKVHEEAQERLDELANSYARLTEGLREAGRSASNVPQPVWVIEGRDNIERAIASLVHTASKELMRITRPPDLRGSDPFDPFYILGLENQRLLDRAVKSGVRIRWLSLTRELPSYAGLDVSEPPERRYLDREEDISEKFFIADYDGVLLNLYDPKSYAFGSMAMLMHSEAAASVFREHFETMWDRAAPLADVLPKIRASVEEVYAKMEERGFGRADRLLYRTLSFAGGCTEDFVLREAQRRKVPPGDASRSLARLVRSGIVRRNTTLRMLMAESPSNVLASFKDGGKA
jgi:HTH-type transcriptional regulator, sugar sensing transcriptional regulator